MAIEDAARRRDFTVNAIAWDPLTDEYLDPFDGRRDLLERRVLRAVDPRTFGDDSLRVLRGAAVRGALRARAGSGHDGALPPHPARRSAGRAHLGRNREAAAPAPSGRRSASRSRSTSASIDRLFPELQALVGCPQEPEWHPEGDVWVHTLLVIDEARRGSTISTGRGSSTVMLGAVCHDLGKPPTTAFIDGRIRSIDHEAGRRRADASRCSIA